MNKRMRILLLVLAVVLGTGLMAYPMLSSLYREAHQGAVITKYQEVMAQEDTALLDAVWEDAQEWNRQLAAGEIDILKPEENGYFDQLLLPGSAVMGYIQIPAIHVLLPIYHGVGSDALSRGVGHMTQSSLPVGGDNTHSVLSAHSGMASSPMFSDLEKMEAGDVFFLSVLGETLAYEVFDIQTVLPQEVEGTQIHPGEDLCTLITCTPYGVNTHRLLVTGRRIPTPAISDPVENPEAAGTTEERGSVWRAHYWRTVALSGIFLLVIVMSTIYCSSRRKRHEQK